MEEWYRAQDFFEETRFEAIIAWTENRNIVFLGDDLESEIKESA